MIDIYRRRPFLMFSHRNNPYCELLQFRITKVGLFSIYAMFYCKKVFNVDYLDRFIIPIKNFKYHISTTYT